MKRQLFSLLLVLSIGIGMVGCSSKKSSDGIALKTKLDTISYILGADQGLRLKNQKIEINPDAYYKGLDYGLNGKDMFSDTLKQKVMQAFQVEMQNKQKEDMAKQAVENKQKGAEFLAKNKARQGVIVMPDGLQYFVIKQGTGKTPGPTDSVTVHYRMSNIEGKVIDQSFDRGPVGIRVTNVVKGLSEGLQLMKEGGICEFYIPSELGFGDQNYSTAIPAGATLVYHVELLAVHSGAPAKPAKTPKGK